MTIKQTGVRNEGGTRSRVNPEVWFSIFHEPWLLACLIEVLKNGFDWGAGVVHLITNEGRERLRHVDDGCGMNARNREAFLSVGYSTAGGDQSGTFGTGAKKIIFTFASNVRVVTAPEDEPNLVYIAEFTPLELAQDYSGQPSVSWKAQPKTIKSWPHEHSFGTDVVYTLKDPGSRSIYRGDRLARKLSDRLDYVLIEGGMVIVDNDRLPAKQLTGRIYRLEFPAEANPAMGRIRLVFYRPTKRSTDEDLRMTGRSIGEVSFRSVFVKLLTEDQRDMVPQLFLDGEVCGLITAGFLNAHTTERRDSYDAHIADDERVMELLRLLNRVEVDVAAHLGIKLRHLDSDETQGREEIDGFIERLQKRYNPGGDLPPDYADPEAEGEDETGSYKGTGRRRPNQSTRLPRLEVDRGEFALGEAITIKLVVPDGSPEGFHFYTDQSRAKVEAVLVGEARLVADELGRGLVQAVNLKTGQSAKVEYEVVTERTFHLSARGPIGTQVGSKFTVQAINADKLRGTLVWELEGEGELKVLQKGLAASFVPRRTGRARIVAYDKANPKVQDFCDILVTPRRSSEPPLRIRDKFFTVEFTGTTLHGYRKPATIVPAGDGEVHRLVFNQLAPGFATALAAGTLQEVLAYSMAVEFAKHFSVNWEEVDASDFASIMLEIQNEAAILFEEMLS